MQREDNPKMHTQGRPRIAKTRLNKKKNPKRSLSVFKISPNDIVIKIACTEKALKKDL